jgi:sterol desaturase/sphingolipid hydroxylase (fatty acid hydroxylase superfamily)
MPENLGILRDALDAFQLAAAALAISVLVFGLIALAVKGREAFDAAARAVVEVRLNLGFYFFDALFVAPGLSVMIAGINGVISKYSLAVLSEGIWQTAGLPITFFAVLFVGDFISYWRHRVEHTRWFWPAHVIHHSDTDMTWLTLSRFHPINRVTTAAIDVSLLALLGFPTWALIANNLVRHYYGEFIHADLPWMYGRFSRIFVSPVMHRWHHARDVTGMGSNFATIFSVFDRGFGTYYVPGLCTVPLGVTDDQYPGKGLIRHLLHPFVAWTRAIIGATRSSAGTVIPAGGVPRIEEHVERR